MKHWVNNCLKTFIVKENRRSNSPTKSNVCWRPDKQLSSYKRTSCCCLFLFLFCVSCLVGVLWIVGKLRTFPIFSWALTYFLSFFHLFFSFSFLFFWAFSFLFNSSAFLKFFSCPTWSDTLIPIWIKLLSLGQREW